MQLIDKSVTKVLWDRWFDDVRIPARILALSPGMTELMTLTQLRPDSIVDESMIDDWHLSNPAPPHVDGIPWWDVVVASNVFLCAEDPMLWFENVLDITDYFFIQDVALGWRGADGMFSDDGEKMRFHFGDEFEPSFEGSFDMLSLGDRLLDYEIYEVPNGGLHFAARLKGNVTDGKHVRR